MTNLEELIETANRLSDRLEKAANDEMKFSYDLQMCLEQMSWQSFKIANELKEIKNYI
ncbi:MAG TPA: hypothetical protein VHZ50_16500 [Puia sp.]|jgi:hypothetical protein|nr:hypothetical protein [Puia sp.]